MDYLKNTNEQSGFTAEHGYTFQKRVLLMSMHADLKVRKKAAEMIPRNHTVAADLKHKNKCYTQRITKRDTLVIRIFTSRPNSQHYAYSMVINHPYTLVQCPRITSFFLKKGFPLISRLIASYVGASDIGHSIYIGS